MLLWTDSGHQSASICDFLKIFVSHRECRRASIQRHRSHIWGPKLMVRVVPAHDFSIVGQSFSAWYWPLYIITTWRGITCRIAITFEGVENPYLPGNVHFQYRPFGDIGVAVVAGAIRNASRWLDEQITWCPLFGGVLSQVCAQAREDLSTRSWLRLITNSIWD